MLPSQPNQSVITALTCLQQVIANEGALGSREAARQLGMEESRVRRMLHTLAGIGLLSRDEQARYHAGPGLHVLAAQALRASGLLAAAMPHLGELRTGQQTAALAVLWQGQVSYLVHARPPRRIEEGIGSHEIHPASHSSLGHILLAHAPDRAEQLKALKESGRTPRGGAAAGADLSRGIGELLNEAKRRGYARLTFPNGEVSVAVAIGDPAIAAIGASSKGLDDAGVEALATRLWGMATAIARKVTEAKGQASGVAG